MFIEERQREIAETIRENGKVTIAEIAQRYGISYESARRDLRLLEEKGLCKRTHGGAIVLQPIGVLPTRDRCFEEMPVFDNYKKIAQAAAEMVRENDVVYLTGGSFGYIMTSLLPKDIHYTLVVNSVDIGKELRSLSNADVYIAGGKMRQSGSLVDSLAAEFVSRIHFDICFITGGGFTADFGLSNGSDETAAFQRTVMKNSRRKYLLMPGAKIGVDSFIKVCDADEFDCVITDWDCTCDNLSAIRDMGIEVISVAQDGGREGAEA